MINHFKIEVIGNKIKKIIFYNINVIFNMNCVPFTIICKMFSTQHQDLIETYFSQLLKLIIKNIFKIKIDKL